MWKAYFRGFGEGLLIDLAVLVVVAIITLTNGDLHTKGHSIFYSLPIGLGNIIYMAYIVTKNKQPKAWMFLALFMSIFALPFLFGAIEVSKVQKKK
jgi:hypothetical protein